MMVRPFQAQAMPQAKVNRVGFGKLDSSTLQKDYEKYCEGVIRENERASCDPNHPYRTVRKKGPERCQLDARLGTLALKEEKKRYRRQNQA